MDSGSRRLVFYSQRSASLSLYLDGLPPELAAEIAILPPSRLETDFPVLAGAGLVVFVRGFEDFWRSGLIAALERIGVPCAWFSDDDFSALRGEQTGFGFYSPQRVSTFAARMVALIGTTAALCDRLSAYRPNVLHWPCVLNETLLPALPTEVDPGPAASPGVAFVGGAFRVDGLKRLVLPALDVLSGAHLTVVEGPAAKIAGVRVLPFQHDFNQFIAAWRVIAPDILVHPPGRTRNIGNKGPGILLTALYLGAVPIVADEPALREFGADQGVWRATNAGDWRAALAAFATPDMRQDRYRRLRDFARAKCAAEAARPAIEGLLALAAPRGAAAIGRQNAAMALGWTPPARFLWRNRLRRIASRSRLYGVGASQR